MKRPIAFLAFALFASVAQARGGRCGSLACGLTAAAVLVAFVLFVFASIYDSVRGKGLLRGILANRPVQFVAVYVAALVFMVAGGVALEKLWGATAAIWALGGATIGVVCTRMLIRSRAPGEAGHADEEE